MCPKAGRSDSTSLCWRCCRRKKKSKPCRTKGSGWTWGARKITSGRRRRRERAHPEVSATGLLRQFFLLFYHRFRVIAPIIGLKISRAIFGLQVAQRILDAVQIELHDFRIPPNVGVVAKRRIKYAALSFATNPGNRK